MSVRDTLTAAKELVEQGWHQGGGTDGNGNYCMWAAVREASGQNEPNIDYTEYFSRVVVENKAISLVAASLPEPFTSIPVYNDDPSTTKDDVLAVLDKAISSC